MNAGKHRKSAGACLLALAAALIVSLPASASHDFVNPSFETGDFSGWSASIPPGGSILVQAGGAPGGRSFFARMKTDGPGSFTTLSQSVTAGPGDTITGYALFDSNDYCPFNDLGQLRIKSGATILATPFSFSTCNLPSFGSTGWVAWSYQVPAVGSYTIEARITNALDSILDSELWVDAMAVVDTTAPTASCASAANPADTNDPDGNAGFWALSGSDLHGVASMVIVDSGSSFISDGFADGDRVKVTQSPGNSPGERRPGSNGLAAHLHLNGDGTLRVTDTSGNVTEVACPALPPKEK